MKADNVDAVRMSGGKLFHAVGPIYAKAHTKFGIFADLGRVKLTTQHFKNMFTITPCGSVAQW